MLLKIRGKPISKSAFKNAERHYMEGRLFKNDGRLKLLIIVGTRPEIIRLSEVIKKCRKYFDTILAHTGQNYDYNLNGIFSAISSLTSPRFI